MKHENSGFLESLLSLLKTYSSDSTKEQLHLLDKFKERVKSLLRDERMDE